MYGIFTNFGPKNGPNIGKKTIYGAYYIGTAFTSKKHAVDFDGDYNVSN